MHVHVQYMQAYTALSNSLNLHLQHRIDRRTDTAMEKGLSLPVILHGYIVQQPCTGGECREGGQGRGASGEG